MFLSNGQPVFAYGGISPSAAPALSRGSWGAVKSEGSSTVCLFGDNRNPNQPELFVQRLAVNGSRIWDSTDVIFSLRLFGNRLTIPDGSGGLIYVGSDEPLNGIFAQEVNREGHLGIVLTSLSEENEAQEVSMGFSLEQNFPNPFNGATLISYHLDRTSQARLVIYDVLGREVIVLNHSIQPAGKYTVVWDGKRSDGGEASSGLYFCLLTNNSYIQQTRKLILIR
jgi:hypothetical protein